VNATIFTFGHGTAGEVELAGIIRGAGVKAVVDVRSIPRSRAHPHVWDALTEVANDGAKRATAIMCSETLWWRCHRRLIADALVLMRGVDVIHLMNAGAPQPHRLTPGVRRLPDGRLQYDA
jgi:uncharacterized protein (DUF488 family)